MVQRGTYFDPNLLVLHNYLDNRKGFPTFTPQTLDTLEKGLAPMADALRRARAPKHVKIVFGTDAVAGSHGRNAEEFIYRVKEAGEAPGDVDQRDVDVGRIARSRRPHRHDRHRSGRRSHRDRRQPARRHRRALRPVHHEGRKVFKSGRAWRGPAVVDVEREIGHELLQPASLRVQPSAMCPGVSVRCRGNCSPAVASDAVSRVPSPCAVDECQDDHSDGRGHQRGHGDGLRARFRRRVGAVGAYPDVSYRLGRDELRALRCACRQVLSVELASTPTDEGIKWPQNRVFRRSPNRRLPIPSPHHLVWSWRSRPRSKEQ